MYHREERIALPAEIGIDAEHEADHDAVDAIAVQIGGAHLHDRLVRGEDAGQRIRQELHRFIFFKRRRGHPISFSYFCSPLSNLKIPL